MARKYRRLSLEEGEGVSIIGLGAGLVALLQATLSTEILLRIFLLLFSSFALWFFPHGLAHQYIGESLGIKFQYYYLGRSAIRKLSLPLITRVMNKIPVLVLKIDPESLAQASPSDRRWMYASGAMVSMGLPWVVVPESFTLGPFWGLLFLALVLGNDLFTLYFSPKTGDLYRARMVKG
jgi:hypothetical protein